MEIEYIRENVQLNEHGLSHVHSSDFPGNYPGFDDKWDFDKFKKRFRLEIMKMTELEMEFDLIGVDASIANAIRRILIAEVPTMAVDKIFISNNTSIIQDEVLAHRLGLIPFKVDPRLFDYRQNRDSDGTELDTLEFELNVTCSNNPVGKDAVTPDEKYINSKVYSSQIVWRPLGAQADMHKNVGPVHDDILIAKMRPGQTIDLKMHLLKGKGQDHAKFSPVATATYRLLPQITLLQPIVGEAAERLKSCFSDGVIGIRTTDGNKEAVVEDPRRDTCTREVFRHSDLKDKVRLSRVRDHFIFSVESTGALEPEILLKEAVTILKNKCTLFVDELKRLQSSENKCE